MVKGHLKADLVAELQTGPHRILTALPEKLGGNDEAPDPHELVEAGLVGCTILTCQLYANRKGWKLTSTNVTVHIEAETKEATRICREVSFEGDLSEEQRQRLLEIADKCPIHNLLQSHITIVTRSPHDASTKSD